MKNHHNQDKIKGFSLIEIMLASALFLIFVTAFSGSIIFGLQSSMSAGSHNRATLLAKEASEIVRNIRDQNYYLLIDGNYGLQLDSNNQWIFTENVENIDGFERTVEISTTAFVTKKVDSIVRWTEGLGNQKEVKITTYLTDWHRTLGLGGMLVYGDSGTDGDAIYYKLLDENGNWSEAQRIPGLSVPGNRKARRLELYNSTIRDEKMLLVKHDGWGWFDDDQYIYALVWDGDSWGNIIKLTSYWGSINGHSQNFGGAYQANGEFIVIYDDFTNTIKYRKWDGSNWSNAQSTVDTGGLPVFARLRNKVGTNEVMVVVRDAGQDTNNTYWTGSLWGASTEHGTSSTGFALDNIDFEWSPYDSGYGALLFNNAQDNTPNIRIWNNGSWSSVGGIDIGATAHSFDLAGRPTQTQFLGCAKDYSENITCFKSDGEANWNAITNGQIATNTDDGTQNTFDVEYSNTGNHALVVYSNGSDANERRIPKYRIYNPSTNSFSEEFSLPELGSDSSSALESVRVISVPYSDKIMVLMGTSDQDLWSIVWDSRQQVFYNTSGFKLTEQGTHGSDDIDVWYDFVWN